MATVYVKKTGNNSNSGTRENPVLDIARAAKIIADSNDNDSEIMMKHIKRAELVKAIQL